MPFDKSLLRPCPVLRPTMAEFASPIDYLSRTDIAELGTKYGLVKIVPPAEWRPPFLLAPTFTFHTRIQTISDLGITTRSRKFFMENLNRFLEMHGRRQAALFFYTAHGRVHYYDLYLALCKTLPGQSNLDGIAPDDLAKLNLLFGLPAASTVLVAQYNDVIRPYALYLADNGDNFDFPDSASDSESDSCVVCGRNHSPTQTLLCDNCNNPYHMKCLLAPLAEVPTGTWYCEKCLVGTGEYGFEENPDVRYNIWEFVEHCKQFESSFLSAYSKDGRPLTLDSIEKIFWDLVESENSQLKVKYGADIHNLKPGEISGFPTMDLPNSPYKPAADAEKYVNHPWNLTKLPFSKGSLLNYINSEISGMTVPWIYVGSLLSTFCWHVEDHYTLSANYCHFGNIKKWYGIPSVHADDFERYMKAAAPDLFQRQPDLLHQLVTLISPSDLAKAGIPCVYADQGPNEFVVTYPKVYHAGFNSGFNFNEAVNFTMDSWLDFGERSIRDYKEIKKENVFDHYNLVENILTSFLAGEEQSTPERLQLIGKCIRSFENFYHRQRRLVSMLENDRLEKKFIPRAKRVKSELPLSPKQEEWKRKVSRMTRSSKMTSHTENDDDDTLCDICRMYVSYQYCNINNHHHRFGRWYLGRPKRRDTVFTVNKLITPDASPNTVATVEDSKLSVAAAIALLDPSQTLQQLQERRPLADELDELIKNAKRKAAEDEEEAQKGKRRRHLRRAVSSKLPEPAAPMEAPEKMSQMRKVQYSTLLRQLNQYDNVKLCLECTAQMCGERGEKAPRESAIVMEREFLDMEEVLLRAKGKYLATSQ